MQSIGKFPWFLPNSITSGVHQSGPELSIKKKADREKGRAVVLLGQPAIALLLLAQMNIEREIDLLK